MKLVIGIVRPEKANDVLESLYRAEVRGVSMSRVQGHGGDAQVRSDPALSRLTRVAVDGAQARAEVACVQAFACLACPDPAQRAPSRAHGVL